MLEPSAISDNLFPWQDKKNIRLIPVNPNVCFATIPSSSTDLNAPVFIPVIDIDGRKYLPIYLKKSIDNQNHQKDQIHRSGKSNGIYQLVSKNPIVPSKRTKDAEATNPCVSPLLKPDIHIERLTISQINLVQLQDDQNQLQISKNNKEHIKVHSDKRIQRSPEVSNHLRAKTVRIGNICWPPPFNTEENDNIHEKRQILVQRRIQQEIHRNGHLPAIDDQKNLLCQNDNDLSINETVIHNKKSMIDEENSQFRKTSFKHFDASSFLDPVPPLTDKTETSQSSSSQQVLPYLTYDKIPWKLKIRKEVFLPTETFDEPIIIDLLYLQIIRDIFSSVCIRISEAERTNMKTFLCSHGIATISDIHLIETLSIKKTIIEQARQWSIYFCRLFPISISKSHSNDVQMLGISHSGIRLIQRHRTTTDENILQVLETFPYDILQHVSSIRNKSTFDLRVMNRSIAIHSRRIQRIKEMIEEFQKEFRTTNHKSISTPLSEPSDLFKSSSQASFMSCSQTFSELLPSVSPEVQTPKPPPSALPRGYSMMEFALQNFKLPNRRRSKKSCKTSGKSLLFIRFVRIVSSDWTWQDYADLIKWSKVPIQTPLLRHSSNGSIRISRQCFLSIMRYMGDHPMARGQTDTDCLFYLLKIMHKHRIFIDEVLCQIIKQLTDNKSLISDSQQRGWKLLVIILIYFIPSEHLQPYFIKYLHDNRHRNEKLVKSCLNHYEQTHKYGGRRNIPNIAEIDLLTSNDQNEGKHQTFLLPGGFPLTILVTPSMVIANCLNLLCARLNISNQTENDEYSIFILSTSKHSSRLLNSNEYLFDILNECIRSNLIDYSMIIKRMVWLTIPFQFNESEMFIDFMYYQLIPEFLEGTMVILVNNKLSDAQMQEISLMVALQYRASNKLGLPSMKEIRDLLPTIILKLKYLHPQQWTNVIHEKFSTSVGSMSIMEAKIKFLNLLQTWPLFGTTFFTVKSIDNSTIRSPCLIGIGRNGILFLDINTRETIFTILYTDVVSIRRDQINVDIKYRNLSQTDFIRCEIDRAQDLVTLSGRYSNLIDRNVTSTSERKTDIQQIHTCIDNHPIRTIL